MNYDEDDLSGHIHAGLMRCLTEFEGMPPEFMDLETLLQAQDNLAGIIQRKQNDDSDSKD